MPFDCSNNRVKIEQGLQTDRFSVVLYKKILSLDYEKCWNHVEFSVALSKTNFSGAKVF